MNNAYIELMELYNIDIFTSSVMNLETASMNAPRNYRIFKLTKWQLIPPGNLMQIFMGKDRDWTAKNLDLAMLSRIPDERKDNDRKNHQKKCNSSIQNDENKKAKTLNTGAVYNTESTVTFQLSTKTLYNSRISSNNGKCYFQCRLKQCFHFFLNKINKLSLLFS
jgi:hypothetical protein